MSIYTKSVTIKWARDGWFVSRNNNSGYHLLADGTWSVSERAVFKTLDKLWKALKPALEDAVKGVVIHEGR